MKTSSYMTRALRAADPRYARVLEKLGHGAAKAPKPAAPTRDPDDGLVALRAEYEHLVGKRPFMGWDADKLREKIAEAKAGA